MPTGYTAGVGDGSVEDFADFAMQCARAFGALVMMRDEPNNAPIPKEFEPNDYYAKSLEAARARLAELSAMTVPEIREAAASSYEEAMDRWRERQVERKATRTRYEAMLAEVRAWEPPTTEHQGLKDFMEEQLTKSIEFDCGGSWDTAPTLVPADRWLAAEMANAKRSIERSTEEHRKEVERAKERTEWVRALRESLQTAETVH